MLLTAERADSRTSAVAVVCIAVPSANGAYAAFVNSYVRFSPGIDHDLYVVFVRFNDMVKRAAAEQEFAALKFHALSSAEGADSLGLYAKIAVDVKAERICFINASCEVRAPNWLIKLDRQLDEPSVGLVGASASSAPLAHWDVGYENGPRIRSNAFMVRRALISELLSENAVGEGWETGSTHGRAEELTAHVFARGLTALVVGRNGRGYGPSRWFASETYAQGTQRNLLVMDTGSRAYEAATWPEKLRLSAENRGESVDGVTRSEVSGTSKSVSTKGRRVEGAASDQTDFVADVSEMLAHIRHVDHPLFRASRFWDEFNAINSSQLSDGGRENFKRSVSQNYFNWVPVSVSDNQFRNVAAFWAANPALDVLGLTLDGESDIATAFTGNPLAQPEIRELYRLFVAFSWHYTRIVCGNGLTETLSEPGLGNPIPTRLAGRLISQDLASSIRERTIALKPFEQRPEREAPLSVVEIGAGYGRLGYVLLSSARCRYTIVDIPPAMALSQWYLGTLFADKRIFRFRAWENFAEVQHELDAADITFMTPDQFALCPPQYFDVGITISTLPEMTRAQFDFYLARLAQVVSGAVYTKQWREHHNAGDNVTIRQSDFVLPAPWRLVLDRIDGIQDAFFERMWIR